MVRAEMNSQYRISVIVPVYNKKKYLGACVDSILGQTYRNLELVLVDDASTDGSGALCDQYAAKDDRVRVIHRQNGGPTAACVTGMEQAGGSHFMFIDSDDYVDPCMLEEMGKHLTGRTGEIVCCDHVLEKRKDAARGIRRRTGRLRGGRTGSGDQGEAAWQGTEASAHVPLYETVREVCFCGK